MATPSELPVAESLQGHYAGVVSRLAALAADLGLIWGLYLLAAAAVNVAVQLISGKTFDLTSHRAASAGALVLWGFVYFTYQWTLSGKTVGMAVLGLRVVQADGSSVRGRQAVVRTLVLGISLLFFIPVGIAMVIQRERRALHDLAAHTAVVYSWDARAARLRWLARQDPAASAAPLDASTPPAA